MQHFCFPRIILLDANLLKDNPNKFIFAVNRFANVALVTQKYLFKCFPYEEVF
jgi:hypothetical protein